MRFNPISILPDQDDLNLNGYFRYSGSLTTPLCTENVTWTISNKFLKISSNQVFCYIELKNCST